MQKNIKKSLVIGTASIMSFIIFTVLLRIIDQKPLGVNETRIGFATINVGFHGFTGVNMTLYNITDWLGLVPVFVCMIFGFVGFIQLIKRKSLLKVDRDIIFSGVYYLVVIACYLGFEMYPINYRPILINGFMEASYPSSTTLLVLSVMPTLPCLINYRVKSIVVKKTVAISAFFFSAFMVLGRLISGVHWLSDIVASVLLCLGLYYLYKTVILVIYRKSE